MSASPDGAAPSGCTFGFDWDRRLDTLRFTTAVIAAVDAGATVDSFRWHDARAAAHTAERTAVPTGPAMRGIRRRPAPTSSS